MCQQKPLLKVEHMYKSFGAAKALQDVSFELQSGQILGLIGENGSGKSTITTIVVALQTADAGEMYLASLPGLVIGAFIGAMMQFVMPVRYRR